MAKYQLKIYGSDTFIAYDSNSENAKTDVTALTPSTATIDIYGTWRYPVPEGDPIEGPGGNKSSARGQRNTYAIRLKGFRFPTEETAFWALMDIINMKYHWIEQIDYENSSVTLHTATKIKAIAIIDYPIEDRGGKRKITINAEDRLPR